MSSGPSPEREQLDKIGRAIATIGGYATITSGAVLDVMGAIDIGSNEPGGWPLLALGTLSIAGGILVKKFPDIHAAAHQTINHFLDSLE